MSRSSLVQQRKWLTGAAAESAGGDLTGADENASQQQVGFVTDVRRTS